MKKVTGNKTELSGNTENTNVVMEKRDVQINIEEKVIEKIEKFSYLRSELSKSGGSDEDVLRKINKTQEAFNML